MNTPIDARPVQAPPLEEALPETLDFKTLFEALLRRPQALVKRLGKPGHDAAGKFIAIAVGALLSFGIVLGCFAKHEQLWAAPLKVTAGVLIAGVICFPSLYIFSTLSGARVSVAQLMATFAGALALAGLLLLGFSPAIWIFAESTNSFGFVGALGIAAWGIAVIFAMQFLFRAMRAAGGVQKGPLVIWAVIFVLVSLQMTTSLRPILGRSPDFLTQEKKFFLQHWGETIGNSLGTEGR